MAAAASSRSSARWMIGVAVVGAMWWAGFEQGERIPLLTYVNLGIHELGHLLTYSFSDLFTALAGSVAQVAVPAALAGYFLLFRGDWLGAGLCLAWGATSALEVAIYVADAPVRELELIGGNHDWAFILGPDGYDAIGRAGALADTIRSFATVAIFTALALCFAEAFRRPLQPAAAASTSRPTPASSA